MLRLSILIVGCMMESAIFAETVCDDDIRCQNKIFICENSDNFLNKSILTTKPDAENGTLDVIYNLGKSELKYSSIVMQVYVEEKPDSKMNYCSKSANYRVHSEIRHQIVWCTNNSAIQYCDSCISRHVIEETFPYIYSACYIISITECDGTQLFNEVTSDQMMLYTQHKKETFIDSFVPEIAPTWIEGSRQISVRIANISRHNHLSKFKYSRIIVKLKPKLKRKENANTYHCTIFDRDPSEKEKILCRPKTGLGYCLIDTDTHIQCVFDDISNGSHEATLDIEYRDTRCIASGLVWNNKCHFSTTISEKANNRTNRIVINAEDNQHEINRKHFFKVPLIMSLVIIVGIVGCAAFIKQCLWSQNCDTRYVTFMTKPKSTSEDLHPITSFSRKKILLLYPRDCHLFMDAMKRFKQVLTQAHCQVVDIWDEDIYNEICERPESWMNGIIGDDNTRVVVVATDCSRLLEKNILSNGTTRYRIECDLDKLFLLALRNLEQTTLYNGYQKVYITSLERNMDEDKCFPNGLAYLNPLRVHILPIHLENLMMNIHRLDTSTIHLLDMSSPEVRNFNDAIDRFIQYKHTHPSYLHDILIIE